MAPKIFISYAHSDRDLADDLRSRLAQIAEPIPLTTPELEPAQDWSRILSELKKADEILVLLTPNSLHSPRVLLAIGAGTSLQKKIVPVVVGLDEAGLPGWIRGTQFVRYSELNGYLHDLARKADEESAAVHGASAKAGVNS